MYSIKIDWKQFARQHYWIGYYYWNSCYDHKHYKSNCEECNNGEWRWIATENSDASALSYKHLGIFKMPMNNVVWTDDLRD